MAQTVVSFNNAPIQFKVPKC